MGIKEFCVSIQQRLPSSNLLRSILFILVLFLILLIVVVIKISKYKHRFWVNKPVAFPSIFPTQIGVIRHDDDYHLINTPHNDTLPDGYNIQHIRDTVELSSVKNKTISVLFQLWNEREDTPQRDAKKDSVVMKHTSLQEVHSLLQQPHSELFLLMKQNTIVGTLLCSPTIIDTPIENAKHIYMAQQLFIHPEHRRKRLAPCLMNYAIDTAKARHQCEPVVLFSVPWKQDMLSQNRLPFAEISKTMRVFQTYQPSLLLDPHTEVNHKLVKQLKDLPSRAFESSDLRISGSPTLELSTDTLDHTKHWEYVLQQPQHIVLSVGGTDWIHLKHIRQNSSTHLSTQTTFPGCILILQGFSFHSNEIDNVVPHLFKYMKTECNQENLVALIVHEPLTPLFDEHSSLCKELPRDNWTFYDAHYLYMYNYKLNQHHVHIPYTLHRDVFQAV